MHAKQADIIRSIDRPRVAGRRNLCHAARSNTGSSDQRRGVIGHRRDVPHHVSLASADLKAMPRMTVTITDHGRAVRYEGMLAP